MKAFNIQDGLGIKLLQQGGIQVGIITGRVSELLQRRATEFGINPVIQGREDKLTALTDLLLTADVRLDELACCCPARTISPASWNSFNDSPIVYRHGLADNYWLVFTRLGLSTGILYA